MGEPIRVLHVLQRMEAGGTQALLMNIYRNIDRKKVQFDFLVEYSNKQFYDDEIKKYIGEVSYYFEEEYREYVLNIIIEYPYRHLGKGKVALELLCKQAKENGLRFLCDDIETNNPAKNLFLDIGFKEVWARENITMLKKRL